MDKKTRFLLHNQIDSVEIGDDVTSIGSYSFYSFTSMTSIDLSSSLKINKVVHINLNGNDITAKELFKSGNPHYENFYFMTFTYNVKADLVSKGSTLLYKKDKTYYLHGKARHFSEEELNLNFWFFDEPININTSPEDDEILFFRHDIFELGDLLSNVFINNLNFYWNLKEGFPISCIIVCDLYEKKYEKIVQKLIDLIKNTTDYDKKDIFIKSLSPFYSKISNKQLIIEAIKITVKTFKDEKINEEKIINLANRIEKEGLNVRDLERFKPNTNYSLWHFASCSNDRQILN